MQDEKDAQKTRRYKIVVQIYIVISSHSCHRGHEEKRGIKALDGRGRMEDGRQRDLKSEIRSTIRQNDGGQESEILNPQDGWRHKSESPKVKIQNKPEGFISTADESKIKMSANGG